MSDHSAELAVLRAQRVFYEARLEYVSQHREKQNDSEMKLALFRAGAVFETGSIERWTYGLMAVDPWVDVAKRLPECMSGRKGATDSSTRLTA